MKNISELISHQSSENIHRGVKKIKKQRNLNIEEHYKIENSHYHDYEL
jgi:hypothetical protein